MDKVELKKMFLAKREEYDAETDSERRKQLHKEGWFLRKKLGLHDDPKIERRQLAAIDAIERERQKGAA